MNDSNYTKTQTKILLEHLDNQIALLQKRREILLHELKIKEKYQEKISENYT